MTRRGTCPSCEGLSKDGHLCRHCTRALQHARDERPWPSELRSGGVGNLPWVDSRATVYRP